MKWLLYLGVPAAVVGLAVAAGKSRGEAAVKEAQAPATQAPRGPNGEPYRYFNVRGEAWGWTPTQAYNNYVSKYGPPPEPKPKGA
jgi:hypothetical protein